MRNTATSHSMVVDRLCDHSLGSACLGIDSCCVEWQLSLCTDYTGDIDREDFVERK